MTKRRKSKAEAPLKSFRTLMTFRLHLVGGQSERFSEQYYRRLFDLSLPECRVIGMTGGVGTVTIKKICEVAHLEKGFASRIINRLADRGIIRKEDNPQDQRSVLVSLTNEGRKLHHDLHAAAVALNQRLMEVLSPEQARVFMTSLVLLHDRLSELAGGGDEAAAYLQAPTIELGAEYPDETSRRLGIDIALAKQLHETLGRLIKRSE